MSHDVVVIGGGVSGLTCAHDLAAFGYDVQVLERQVAIGGNAITERFDGFLMEHGPSALNASVTGAMDRISALGLADTASDLGPMVRKRFLVNEGKISPISTHPLGFFMSGYLSIPARLSLAAEILRPRKSGGVEETVHEFVSRRFGKEFAEKVIDPMAAGLFMGDARNLSIESTFPKLAEMERKLGSITRGVLQAKRGSEPGRRLFSWREGMAAIPQQLASLIEGRVHSGVTVTEIIPTPSGFRIITANSGTLETRAVVLAVQPHVAATLLTEIDPAAATAAQSIAAPPIGVVFFGFKRQDVTHPLDGLGFLSTRNENSIISGAQFCSTMFEGRAPTDHVSISCYSGGTRNPGVACIADADLIDLVKTELADLLGITGEPVLARTRRWVRGLPQYEIGHSARLEVLKSTNLRIPGLFMTGNYLQGVSIANCMEAAAKTASQVRIMLDSAACAPDAQQVNF